jgi:hypothetical protein
MVEEVLGVIFDALGGGSTTSGLKSLSVHYPVRGFRSREVAVPIAAIARVENLMRSCKVLEKLELCEAPFGLPQDDEVWQETLVAVLPGLCGSSIQSLSLDRLDEATVPKFIRALSNETCSLRSLEVRNATSASVTSAIAEVVRNSPLLKKLKLGDGHHVLPAAAELLGHSRLKELNLQPISAPSVTTLSAAIANGHSSLETLCLQLDESTDRDLEALIRVIPGIPSLKNLILDVWRLPEDTARLLGEMIPETTTLKSIKLERNCLFNVTRENLQTLLAGLENNTSIEEFEGIPYHVEQTKAAYLCSLNKADRKSYVETDNMQDNDWVKAIHLFGGCGGLSGLYFALRSKTDLIHRRPDSTANHLGKRKRDDP